MDATGGWGLFFSPFYSVKGRFRGRPRSPSVDPPAPSPPTSLRATATGEEPGSMAEGLCIAVDVGLLASIYRRWR